MSEVDYRNKVYRNIYWKYGNYIVTKIANKIKLYYILFYYIILYYIILYISAMDILSNNLYWKSL